jgi:uncharacterized repeat protein (TIGR01451 family)
MKTIPPLPGIQISDIRIQISEFTGNSPGCLVSIRPYGWPILILLFLLIAASSFAGAPKNSKSLLSPASTATADVYRPILINNVFNYYGNNGDGSFNSFSADNEGFEFPKGEGKTTVFEDGIVWGARQRDTIKVGGSAFRHGLQPGPILVNGTSSSPPVPDDPANVSNRIYRVRRDMKPIPGVTSPNDPQAADQLATLLSEEVPLIGRYQNFTAADLLQQYWEDWNGWPATQGAPFTDINHNGIYEPAIDVPCPLLADQSLWYVANDLDPTKVVYLAGSTPIGIEMQKTVWAYKRGGALANTVFSSTRIINKSGITLDSVFIVQWADPDVGHPGDDFVGCDTARGLGYGYNSTTADALYGSSPPAVGFLLLHGPSVPGVSSDTAYVGFGLRPGFRNLPMSAFVFFIGGSSIYTDPAQGSEGYVQWFRLMNATLAPSGAPFLNPLTGQPTHFTCNGDPVTGAGWVDGLGGISSADRRFCMVTGPLTMAPGDTQEIAIACLAARGVDRLSSVSLLRTGADNVRQAYNNLTSGLIQPSISYSIARTGSQATLSCRLDGHWNSISDAMIRLKTYDDSLVAVMSLADDGMHDDGVFGDSIFGGSVTITPLAKGIHAEAVITYGIGTQISWGHVLDNIATADLDVISHPIVSDNINNDDLPNPGENVRYTLSLRNSSPLKLTGLTLVADPVSVNQQLALGTLDGNTTHTWAYDAADPNTYFAFDVPSAYADSTFAVELTIADGSYNEWKDTLMFPVEPLKSKVYFTPLEHIAGPTTESFGISIVDQSQVKNHLYVIRGSDTAGFVGRYSVKDSTTGVVLLQNHLLPDSLGHTSPVVDGFKVLIGTFDDVPGMKSWLVTSGTRRLSPTGGYPGLGLEGFFVATHTDWQDRTLGTIGSAGNLIYGGIGTTLHASDYHTVLLKLVRVDYLTLWDPKAAPTDSNYSRAYRYLGNATVPPADTSFEPWIVNPAPGFPYQGFDYSVPFSAWDIDTDPPTRLAVGCMENNVAGGKVDGRYWPGITTGDNSVAREIALIFKSPYTTTPNPAFAVNLENNASTPLMWVMTCARRSDMSWAAGDQFEIIANHLPTPQDAWIFNPSVVTGVRLEEAPSSYALFQNFPNPFNASTHIRYSVGAVSGQQAAASIVEMKVYDLLGREVAVLVDGPQAAGTYDVQFDGNRLASGVYFYRLRAGAFVQTQKMVLVK